MSIFALRSNGLAFSAHKNLSRTQSSLNANIQRLSSGLRINSTADDSAGSNVSVRMSNQVSGMSQANRNAQNANNLLVTAESGLSDISDILSKMRELSVQAATDTLNNTDRASIDLEFQSLKDELTRIANVTEYNGMNVLNGTYQQGRSYRPWSLANNQNNTGNNYDQYQPGTSNFSDPHGIAGPAGVNADGPVDGPYDGDNIRGHWRLQIGADNDINNQHEFSVMNATANGLRLHAEAETNLADFKNALRDHDIGIDIDKTNGKFADGSTAEADRLRLRSDGTNLYVVASQPTTFNEGSISTSDNGSDITVATTAIDLATSGFYAGTGKAVIHGDVFDYTTATFNGDNTITLAGVSNIDNNHGYGSVRSVIGGLGTVTSVGLTSGSEWTTDYAGSATTGSVTTAIGNNGLVFGGHDTNVSDIDSARNAITDLDHAIDEINRERSYVGSEQNKLQFTMSNLTSNIQSIESARSSIEDVDFAAEAADLAKNQILAQSGTAMLAQAAAISQNILSLLA